MGHQRLVNAQIRQRGARNERVNSGRVIPMQVEDIDDAYYDEL